MTSRSSLGAGTGAERVVDVPLVLHLGGGLGADRIHLHASSGCRRRGSSLRASSARRTSRPSRRCSTIFGRVGRFQLVHRLRDDLERDVVAPGLVLRRLAVFLGEVLDELLRAGVSTRWCHTSGQMPKKLPLPAPQATAVSKPKPATGKCRPNSAYCLRKLVIWLPARLDDHEVGLAPGGSSAGYGEKSETSVGTSSSAGELAAVLLHEQLGDLQQVMAERVVGRQRVPLLAFDHVRRAAGTAPTVLHIHRVLRPRRGTCS